jgi:chaperonin GroES
MLTDDAAITDEAMPAEAETNAEPETINPLMWVSIAPGEANLVEFFSEEQRSDLAKLIADEYEIDKDSMSEWLGAMDVGLKLASGVRSDKTFPWKGASNIKYPLVISAALQFNARAYPAIVPPGDIVKVVHHGKDAQGMKAARAGRVGAFMSYQLRHKMTEWEGDTDRLLIQLAIVGKMFRKTWFDPSRGRIVSRVCKPGVVIVNNAVQSLEMAPRISEELTLYPHEIVERQRAGLYLDGSWWMDAKDEGDEGNDTQSPSEFIEQHRLYDFDGDGYPEPYVCVLHKASQTVVRIAANWQPQDVATDGQQVLSIKRSDYYEAYDLVPAPDGGFWSIGLGVLLKDLSESINDTINRLNDAATLASLGGGFIGKEARLAGGPMRFSPGEWKQVTAGGQDLRAAVVPLPVTPPSPVLFQLLGLLLDAAREVANVKDIAGEAQRSNQPATTTLALIEQGMAVFTAIYKRIHRSLRGEFSRMAEINAATIDPMEYQTFHDEPADPAADFNLDDMDIEPTADPRAVTNPQKLAQAQFLGELAAAGQVNPAAATQRSLEAAGIPQTDELMPQPDPMAELMAETQVRAAMLANVEHALRIAEIEARITDLHASATKKMAEAEAADPMNPVNIALAQVQALKGMVDADRRRLDGLAQQSGNGGGAGSASQGGGSPQGGMPDEILAFGGSGPAPVGQGADVFGPV